MRSFNGSADYLSNSKSKLSGASGPFTICGWYTPDTASQGSDAVLWINGANGGNHWKVVHLGTNLEFRTSGLASGSMPTTQIPLNAGAGARHHWCVRKVGSGSGEWAYWVNGAKQIVNASASFTFGALSAAQAVGCNGTPGEYVDGDQGELAIFGTAIPEEWIIEMWKGAAADQFGGNLIAYYPLRGTHSPEWDYTNLYDSSEHLTVTNATAATHLPIVPSIYPQASKQAFKPVTVIDIEHDTLGTFSYASADLYDDVDVDVLGSTYNSGVLGEVPITLEGDVGLSEPSDLSFTIANPGGAIFAENEEWRGARVRIREYERVSHAVATRFQGRILNPIFTVAGRVTFQGTAKRPEFSLQIPRKLVKLNNSIESDEDGTIRPVDVGYPVPVPCGGPSKVSPPFLEVNEDQSGTFPGGARFLVAWGEANVRRAWFDDVAETPGLEAAVVWRDFEGSPVVVDSDEFKIDAARAEPFIVGSPIRWVPTGDPAGAYVYARIVARSLASSKVTIQISVPYITGSADDPMSDLQVAEDFYVEIDKWKYVGVSTTWMTTVLDPWDGGRVPIFEVEEYNATGDLRGNPARFCKFIMEDVDQGLGLTVNSDSFDDALAKFLSVGMDEAIQVSLGGDRSTDTARAWIKEACDLYGMRIWEDYDSGEFMFEADGGKTDTTGILTLSYGDQSSGLMKMPVSRRVPLTQSPQSVRLRYGLGGRVLRETGNLLQRDYAYDAVATAASVGLEEVVVPSRLIQNHEIAARAVWYRAKKAKHEDERYNLAVDPRWGWRMEIKDLVKLDVTQWSKSEVMRIKRLVRRRGQVDVLVVGFDASEMFETTLATIQAGVDQPAVDAYVDERTTDILEGANLLRSSDWQPGLRRDEFAGGSDSDILPGWTVSEVGSMIDSVTFTEDVRAFGGGYLTVTSGSPGAGPYYWRISQNLGFAANEGDVFALSINANTDLSIETNTAFYFHLQFKFGGVTIGAGDITLDMLAIAPGQRNALGWDRLYAIFRVPALLGGSAVDQVDVDVGSDVQGQSLDLDGFKMERLLRGARFPTRYSRNPDHGLIPASKRSNDEHIDHPEGEAEAGAGREWDRFYDKTCSGSSILLGQIGAGDLMGAIIFVDTAIVGPTDWQIVLGNADPELGEVLYEGLGLARLSNHMGKKVFQSPYAISTPTNVYAVFNGGNATAGNIDVAFHRFVDVPRGITT